MERSWHLQNSVAFIIAMNVLRREMKGDGLMANDNPQNPRKSHNLMYAAPELPLRCISGRDVCEGANWLENGLER